MRIKITIPATYGTVLNKMAQEAQVSVDDLARIAVFNIIALWMAEKGYKDDCLIPNSACEPPLYGGEPRNDADPKVL